MYTRMKSSRQLAMRARQERTSTGSTWQTRWENTWYWPSWVVERWQETAGFVVHQQNNPTCWCKSCCSCLLQNATYMVMVKEGSWLLDDLIIEHVRCRLDHQVYCIGSGIALASCFWYWKSQGDRTRRDAMPCPCCSSVSISWWHVCSWKVRTLTRRNLEGFMVLMSTLS